jgi:hypothetical protein
VLCLPSFVVGTDAHRTYLVECYAPDIRRPDVDSAAERAVSATAALRGEGCSIEYVGAMLVPADEVVFHVFISPCSRAVREASERAAVAYERIVESVAVGALRLERSEG